MDGAGALRSTAAVRAVAKRPEIKWGKGTCTTFRISDLLRLAGNGITEK